MDLAVCESPELEGQTIVDVETYPPQGIRTYLPIEGESCWECGEQRYLMVRMTLKGETVSCSDFCGDPFCDIRDGAGDQFISLSPSEA